MRKHNRRPDETPQSNLRRVSESCAKVLEHVDAHIEKVVTGENVTDHDMTMVGHLAALSRNIAAVGGELRKMEAHEAKLELTDAQLIEHFRKMTPARRAQWGRDLAEMDQRKGSVLA